MSTSTHSGVVADRRTIATYRIVADSIQRWLAMLGFILCAVQIAFAASGFWGVVENPGDQAAGIAAFEPHFIMGKVLQYLALVLLVLGVLSRANWKSWAIPLVLAILLFVVQGVLVGLGFELGRWYGALHAFDGTIITAGFVWLWYDRWRHPLSHNGATTTTTARV